MIFQIGEDPDREENENFIPDLFQEGEMKANREEVFEMKGDGAEIEVTIEITLIGVTLAREEVKAEDGSTETEKKDLRIGMNMLI